MRKFLLAGAIAMLPAVALAQFAPAPPGSTTIDLAPIVNPLIMVLGTIITGLLIPLLWMWIKKTLASHGIDASNEILATQAVIDGIAQRAIGEAISKLSVVPGQITVDAKNAIVAEAANSLIKNAGEQLDKLGVKDSAQITKARDIIQSRLGLMDAAAAGVPVPNPSQPAPVAAAAVITERKTT